MQRLLQLQWGCLLGQGVEFPLTMPAALVAKNTSLLEAYTGMFGRIVGESTSNLPLRLVCGTFLQIATCDHSDEAADLDFLVVDERRCREPRERQRQTAE